MKGIVKMKMLSCFSFCLKIFFSCWSKMYMKKKKLCTTNKDMDVRMQKMAWIIFHKYTLKWSFIVYSLCNQFWLNLKLTFCFGTIKCNTVNRDSALNCNVWRQTSRTIPPTATRCRHCLFNHKSASYAKAYRVMYCTYKTRYCTLFMTCKG